MFNNICSCHILLIVENLAAHAGQISRTSFLLRRFAGVTATNDVICFFFFVVDVAEKA
jgi:predicted acyltransferase